jgi:hypothetical protein
VVISHSAIGGLRTNGVSIGGWVQECSIVRYLSTSETMRKFCFMELSLLFGLLHFLACLTIILMNEQIYTCCTHGFIRGVARMKLLIKASLCSYKGGRRYYNEMSPQPKMKSTTKKTNFYVEEDILLVLDQYCVDLIQGNDKKILQILG